MYYVCYVGRLGLPSNFFSYWRRYGDGKEDLELKLITFIGSCMININGLIFHMVCFVLND